MIRTVAISLLFACAPAAMAMDSTDVALLPVSGTGENPVIEMSLMLGFAYLGICEDREEIEKIYGKSFPLNTIFVPITFEGYGAFTDEDGEPIPRIIPYDDIREMKEDGLIELSFNGKKRTICCRQKGNGASHEPSFEWLLNHLFRGFAKKPDIFMRLSRRDLSNKLSIAQESLQKDGVIDMNYHDGKLIHGKNRSPFVQIEK